MWTILHVNLLWQIQAGSNQNAAAGWQRTSYPFFACSFLPQLSIQYPVTLYFMQLFLQMPKTNTYAHIYACALPPHSLFTNWPSAGRKKNSPHGFFPHPAESHSHINIIYILCSLSPESISYSIIQSQLLPLPDKCLHIFLWNHIISPGPLSNRSDNVATSPWWCSDLEGPLEGAWAGELAKILTYAIHFERLGRESKPQINVWFSVCHQNLTHQAAAPEQVSIYFLSIVNEVLIISNLLPVS